jgi:hypothetical protein
MINKVTPIFFLITKHDVEIPKNQPLRVIIGLREVTNELASEKFVLMLGVAIDASGSPFRGIIHYRNKDIKIVKIRIYNVNHDSTIIP